MTDDLSAPSHDLSAYAEDLSAIERRVTREFSFGRLRPVVIGLICVLAVSLLLPFAGGDSAVGILTGAAQTSPTVPQRLFLGFVLVFGLGVSTVAVATRRWSLSWLAMIGTAMGFVFGMLACWSQQSMPEPVRPSGLGAGILLAWAATGLLAVQWATVTWSRANVMQTEK